LSDINEKEIEVMRTLNSNPFKVSKAKTEAEKIISNSEERNKELDNRKQ